VRARAFDLGTSSWWKKARPGTAKEATPPPKSARHPLDRLASPEGARQSPRRRRKRGTLSPDRRGPSRSKDGALPGEKRRKAGRSTQEGGALVLAFGNLAKFTIPTRCKGSTVQPTSSAWGGKERKENALAVPYSQKRGRPSCTNTNRKSEPDLVKSGERKNDAAWKNASVVGREKPLP